MPKPTEYDVWFTTASTVYRGVPFSVVAGWAGQGRLAAQDKIREVGNEAWSLAADVSVIADYLGGAAELDGAGDAAAYEPVEIDVGWPRHFSEEDDDVDMIPLIDISLVLLIFFIMTTAVSAFSPVVVPDLKWAGELSADKDTISLNVDKQGDQPNYSISVGGSARQQDAKNPNDMKAVLVLLDAALAKSAVPPEVRIACHKDLPRWVVADLMQELKLRKDKNQIAIFTAEVSEKSK
ncbi:MAG TPA: biopolymer transporter ExbD [Fimbriiglobus sp.]|jgi:biopolymer transport protein ExbD